MSIQKVDSIGVKSPAVSASIAKKQNVNSEKQFNFKESPILNVLASYNKANVSFGSLKDEQSQAIKTAYTLAGNSEQNIESAEELYNEANKLYNSASTILEGTKLRVNSIIESMVSNGLDADDITDGCTTCRLDDTTEILAEYKVIDNSSLKIEKITINSLSEEDEEPMVVEINDSGDIEKINTSVKGSIPKDYHAEKVYTYKDGNVENVISDLSVTKDRKWAKNIVQYDKKGNLTSYMNNYAENKSLSKYSVGTRFDYKDNELKEIYTNFRYNPTEEVPYNAAKSYIFENETLSEILAGIKLYPEYPNNLSPEINV